MEPESIERYRARLRVSIFELLVLRHALLEPVLNGYLSIEESQKALELFLDQNSSVADSAFGSRFPDDPAMTALYADETKELIEEIKSKVRRLAEASKEVLAKHGKS